MGIQAEYTEHGGINAIIDGEELFIPDDMGNRHRRMIAEWEAEGNVIAPYVPAPIPAPMMISRRQFYAGLAVAGKITQGEAIEAMKTGTIPAAIQSIIDDLGDADAKFAAEMKLIGAAEFDRTDPLVTVFATAQGMTESDVGDFWTLCSGL